MQYVLWILQILVVPALSPLGVGLINVVKAKMQRRQGPSIWQPYRNLRKLFHKDEVISRDASWIFRFAPYIIFAVMLVVGTGIPLFTTTLSSSVGDVIAVIYLLAIATFFLALAGMDTGSAFGGFGSSREMTMSALAEGSLILSVATVVMLCGTTNLTSITIGITSHYGQFFVPVLLAFAGFIIVLLAETSRFPFDNADTHLELTMIHEAMILEYSGKRLALMEWASASKLFIFSSLAINLFFPLGISTSNDPAALALGLGTLLCKLAVIYIGIALLESSIAKYRFFRLPDLLMIAFIADAFAIGLIR